MNKKCAIYLRVSKSDESQTPENQKEPLRKMAESLGLEVVEEYIDMASGGNSNRPQFQKMLKDAKVFVALFDELVSNVNEAEIASYRRKIISI